MNELTPLGQALVNGAPSAKFIATAMFFGFIAFMTALKSVDVGKQDGLKKHGIAKAVIFVCCSISFISILLAIWL